MEDHTTTPPTSTPSGDSPDPKPAAAPAPKPSMDFKPASPAVAKPAAASLPTLEDDDDKPEPVSSPSPSAGATPPAKPKTHKALMVVFLLVFLLLISAAIAMAMNYKQKNADAEKQVTALKAQLVVSKDNTHDLPEGAIKVSECIPNMGFHYVDKKSDPVYGPFLLVSKAGRVIGVEYMFNEEMFTAIPKTVPPVEVLLKDSPMYGWKFDHTEMSHLPQGHEGFLKDHIDVHNYTVTADQQKQACV